MERVLKRWEDVIGTNITTVLIAGSYLIMVLFFYDSLFNVNAIHKKTVILVLYFSLFIGSCISIYISYMWKRRLKDDSFDEVNLDNKIYRIMRLIIFAISHISFWYIFANADDFFISLLAMFILAYTIILVPKFRSVLVGEDFFAFNGKRYLYSQIHGYEEEFGFKIMITSYGYTDDVIRCRTLKRYNYILNLLVQNNIKHLVSGTSDIT